MRRPILEVDAVVAGYSEMPILNGLSLQVATDEIVAVVGPNGAGKSTLLKAIIGLIKVSAGRISFCGDDITQRSPEDVVRRGIGYVPQIANVFPTLSVHENLALMVPRRSSRAEKRERIDEMLALFPNLKARLAMRAKLLSGGERQMLAIARGLMTRPTLLMLDEPTAAAAPVVVDEIFRKIAEVNATGVSVLLVEQNARKALALSTRGYVLEGGRNALAGPATELLADPEIARLYLGGTRTQPQAEVS